LKDIGKVSEVAFPSGTLPKNGFWLETLGSEGDGTEALDELPCEPPAYDELPPCVWPSISDGESVSIATVIKRVFFTRSVIVQQRSTRKLGRDQHENSLRPKRCNKLC
jgi:hypothetical protein